MTNIPPNDDEPITDTIPAPPVEAIQAGDAESALKEALYALGRLEALSAGIARALDLTAMHPEAP